jgi:hypothetical protein
MTAITTHKENTSMQMTKKEFEALKAWLVGVKTTKVTMTEFIGADPSLRGFISLEKPGATSEIAMEEKGEPLAILCKVVDGQ